METKHATIHAALVAALSEMPAITKGSTAKVPMKAGGSYSYSYADLASVLDVVRPILARHGLALTQQAGTPERGAVEVATQVLWEGGGELMFGTLRMPIPGDGPQGIGSAITYARRYAVLAALGIATDDDDGQAAQHAYSSARAASPATSSGPDDRHIKSIAAHLRALGITAREDRLAKLTDITHRVISSSKDLTESEVHRVLHQLAAERKAEEDRGFNAGEADQ